MLGHQFADPVMWAHGVLAHDGYAGAKEAIWRDTLDRDGILGMRVPTDRGSLDFLMPIHALLDTLAVYRALLKAADGLLYMVSVRPDQRGLNERDHAFLCDALQELGKSPPPSVTLLNDSYCSRPGEPRLRPGDVTSLTLPGSPILETAIGKRPIVECSRGLRSVVTGQRECQEGLDEAMDELWRVLESE